MTMESPIRIISSPGIKRDGTLLEGDNYVDGQWMRFNRGLPRKMQGYRNVVSASVATEKVYGLHAFAQSGQEYLHAGSTSKLLQYVLDYNSTFIGATDRTPVGGFNPNYPYLWQMCAMYDTNSGNTRIIAHPGQNLTAIDSPDNTNIFYGDITGTGALTYLNNATAVSGGICYIAPFLFKFGNFGLIEWSVVNNPNDWLTGLGTAGGPGSARVTGSKVIRGMPLRGSGSGPAAIFWSLDSLIRATFTPTNATFAFDTLSDEISVLATMGIVEVDGVYYWPAVDRFMMFNGVVREVPNQFNNNWFFDNLNYQWRQKCFALKIPRWGEIWWCYPRGTATECTDAVIYNYRDNIWYDTVLPNGGRTSGTFANTYEHPFMTGLAPSASGSYPLWKHEETSSDEINGTAINAIRSFFRTNEITMLDAQQAADKATRVALIEPDFVQSGDMSVTVIGRANARATEVASPPIVFPDDATDLPNQQILPLQEVRRLMSFQFESNVLGGDYEMGKCYAHVEPADSRRTD
jgi:hypothetical protein